MDWEEAIYDAYHTFDDEEDKEEESNVPKVAYDFDKDDYLYHLYAERDEEEMDDYLWG